jgi:beta-lactamase class A
MADRLTSIQKDTEALASLLDDESQHEFALSGSAEAAGPQPKRPRLRISDSDDDDDLDALLQILQTEELPDGESVHPRAVVADPLPKDWTPFIEQQRTADGLPNTPTGRAIAINRLYQVPALCSP